ncbi:MAG: hypothetical protein GX493_03265, partial [Firmicutes bacterium]|nr:hypothetical protein [Bacillota bacterium]
MIINSLYNYYRIIESDLPTWGFKEEDVSFALNLSPDGDVLDVIPLYTQEGRRRIPKKIQVPARRDPRTVKIFEDF